MDECKRKLNMAEEQKQPVPAPAIYTEEDMSVREDLLEKLMTLEHVKAGLMIRDESEVYINQINNLQRLVQGWYTKAVNEKRMKVAEPVVTPAAGTEEPGEGDE
jgi:hypothetical protein